MSKRKTQGRDLEVFTSFLAESVAQMSDEQLQDEYGHEPLTNVKELFQTALKKSDQAKLRDARSSYERSAEELSSRSYTLPKTAPERRALLSAFLGQHADVRTALTVQFRDFEDITDSDVVSLLKQLTDLGMI